MRANKERQEEWEINNKEKTEKILRFLFVFGQLIFTLKNSRTVQMRNISNQIIDK